METECPGCDDLLRERDGLVARLAAVEAERDNWKNVLGVADRFAAAERRTEAVEAQYAEIAARLAAVRALCDGERFPVDRHRRPVDYCGRCGQLVAHFGDDDPRFPVDRHRRPVDYCGRCGQLVAHFGDDDPPAEAPPADHIALLDRP